MPSTKGRAWDKGGDRTAPGGHGGQSLNTASAMAGFFLNMMAGVGGAGNESVAETNGNGPGYKKAHREAMPPTPYGFDRAGNSLIPNEREMCCMS